MTNHSNVVSQDVWDEAYKGITFVEANDALTRTADAFLDGYSFHEGASYFELGCFPGRYMLHFGRKYGLVVNGIDMTDELDERFIDYLSGHVNVGTVQRGDVFEYINKYFAQGGGGVRRSMLLGLH